MFGLFFILSLEESIILIYKFSTDWVGINQNKTHVSFKHRNHERLSRFSTSTAYPFQLSGSLDEG
jgi:hypothetical protein